MTIATRVLDLSLLTRAQGFIITGDSFGDRAGSSVSSTGDVNGDGIDDLIVGARLGDNGGYNAGEAYVIYGVAGNTRGRIDLSTLADGDGFIIRGDASYDNAGYSVSGAGDINGDGIDDLIVGAPFGDNGGSHAGEAYVIFGKIGAMRADIDLTTLTAADGFILQGDSADRAGFSISSAGDVNGDGTDDMIVGAPWSDNDGRYAGAAYVIFGKIGATRTDIDLTALAAADGFIIQGDSGGDLAGTSVSSAGDVNGDGFDDLIVGAPYGNNGGRNAGEAYVIFGKAGATRDIIDLTTLAPTDGFIIQGDRALNVSSVGDVNGDGIDDLIIGAKYGDNGGALAGEAYVIFGKVGATRANIDLTNLKASDGFIIQGDRSYDKAGFSVSSAGDVNNDGIDDLIVGAPFGDNGGNLAGEAYVIFGKAGTTRANIDLTTLATTDGFIIQGDGAYDNAGWSVSSAGDVNGDGIDDLIVGAPHGDNGGTSAGEAYIIYGSATIGLGGDITGTDGADRLDGTEVGERIFGRKGDDTLSGWRGDDELRGGRGDDVLRGGRGNDSLQGDGGRDVLVGGLGPDTFLFFSAGDDRIADFVLGTDTLALDKALTGGLTDVAAVITTFATVVGADLVFDFGDGRTIRLTDLGTTAGLTDDVLII